jgi:hypothetical protein
MNQTLFVLFSLSVGCALGCSSGGQSFDDGSGDLGKHTRSDQGPRRPLSEQPSLRITSGPIEDSSSLPYFSVSFLGDLDADGFSDFAVTDGENANVGGLTAYVFYGRREFPDQLALEDADFQIEGVQDALTPLGDFNGDGIDDVAFVELLRDGRPSGKAELWLGARERANGFVSAADVPARFLALGDPTARSFGLMTPGDVNGDALADVVISTASPAQLAFGTSNPAGAGNPRVNLDLSLPDQRLWGDAVGDLDGDGINDLLAYSGQGTVLYYGRSGGWGTPSQTLEPDAVFNGWMRGFGDWDGDGYGDLAQLVDIYTSGVHAEQPRQLRHQIVFSYGSAQRFSGVVIPPRPPADASYSFDARFARGDINGDGQPDLILGSPDSAASLADTASDVGAPHSAGAVFYQRATGARSDELSFGELNTAFRGRDGSGDRVGLSVASGGDANGDGYQDLLILRNPTADDPVEATLVFGGSGL